MKKKTANILAGVLIFTALGVVYNLLMLALGWLGLIAAAVLGAVIGVSFYKKEELKEFSKATEGFDWDDTRMH